MLTRKRKRVSDEPWDDFVEDPYKFLRDRGRTTMENIGALKSAVLDANLSVKAILEMAYNVRSVIVYNGQCQKNLVLLVRDVLRHMVECMTDELAARVVLELSEPRSAGEEPVLENWGLDRFFEATSEYRRMAAAGQKPRDEFGHLACSPWLVQPVARHTGLSPTYESVLNHLGEYHGGAYLNETLRLWDSNEDRYPTTSEKYSFFDDDGVGDRKCRSSLWGSFGSDKEAHYDRMLRTLRRYSLDSPKTPATLLICGLRDKHTDCWSFPVPMTVCPCCPNVNTEMTYDAIVRGWDRQRSTAVADIESALLLRTTMPRELVRIVLAFLTLDRPTRIELPKAKPKPATTVDGVPFGAVRDDPHARERERELSARQLAIQAANDLFPFPPNTKQPTPNIAPAK